MNITLEKLKKIFKNSLSSFLKNDVSLILNNVNERAFCGRLAMYLHNVVENDQELVGYYVDLEYNRKQGIKIKTIINQLSKVLKINCDIIVHSRGEKKEIDNLIAIELKKSNIDESK